MELDRQLEVLINDAANYGVNPVAIEHAIAPVLRMFANQLQHLEYYILQNMDENWVLTTIANPQLEKTKNVIYAFVSVKDAAKFGGKSNPDLIAISLPIAQLLFRLFSLPEVDSIIFMEDSQNLSRGVEIEREHLSDLIKQQIKQLSNIPPDIA